MLTYAFCVRLIERDALHHVLVAEDGADEDQLAHVGLVTVDLDGECLLNRIGFRGQVWQYVYDWKKGQWPVVLRSRGFT